MYSFFWSASKPLYPVTCLLFFYFLYLDIIHPHNTPFLSFNLLHLLSSFTISSDRPQNFISPITPALLTPVQESQRWRKVKSSCQTSHPKSYSGKKNQIENESKPILPNLPPWLCSQMFSRCPLDVLLRRMISWYLKDTLVGLAELVGLVCPVGLLGLVSGSCGLCGSCGSWWSKRIWSPNLWIKWSKINFK